MKAMSHWVGTTVESDVAHKDRFYLSVMTTVMDMMTVPVMTGIYNATRPRPIQRVLNAIQQEVLNETDEIRS